MKDRKRAVKKRNILYLIEGFLVDNGYKETAQCLRNEAKLNNEYVVCDNINLENIVVEYETYYQQRFQSYPQLCKRIEKIEKRTCADVQQNSPKKLSKIKEHRTDRSNELDLMIYSTSLLNPAEEKPESKKQSMLENDDWHEFKEIAQDICIENTDIRWNEVKGMENVKEILKEAIIYPIKYPHLFTGVIEPWKGVLLYGPPGTGKTTLAKAVATESKATFFNVSASAIVNKWRGETEKIIKAIFEMALRSAPSIIFIDEIDALVLRRTMQQHEASRRMKSEIFAGMDASCRSKNVFILATTNTPWDLDEAVIRRFEKQIFIPLPDVETRKSLFQHFLPNVISQMPPVESDINYEYAAEITENFSGCDIKNLCKNLIMNSIREIFMNLESTGNTAIQSNKLVIRNEDFDSIIAIFPPTVRHLVDKYLKWDSERNFRGA